MEDTYLRMVSLVCCKPPLLLLSAVVVVCRQAARVGAVGVTVGDVVRCQRNKD